MKGIRLSAMEQTANIVVMGSSRAHHYYVPSVLTEVTGMTAHNAGMDGTGIITATGLYYLMAERYQPKVIIYDVEPAFDINVYEKDDNFTRYIGWLRPYFNHAQVKDIICRVNPMERYKNLSAMFRYNSDIADLLKDQVVLSDYSTDGYAPLHGEMKENPIFKNSISNEKPDTLKLKMMEEFIARMSQSETRLIMVASPKYGAISSDVFAPIKELCERYGIEFWDYYRDEEFQKLEYFKEKMHFNDKGARFFTKYLAQRIVAGNK